MLMTELQVEFEDTTASASGTGHRVLAATGLMLMSSLRDLYRSEILLFYHTYIYTFVSYLLVYVAQLTVHITIQYGVLTSCADLN
jgi:hypothetical protein